MAEREMRARLETLEEKWEKKLKLEGKIDDPNRYRNRRAVLLTEEKERNKLNKEIAEMELHLLKLAKTFEVVYNKSFTTRGFTIEEIIEIIREGYRNFKTERINATKNQRCLSPMPHTSRSVSPSFSGSNKKSFSTFKKTKSAENITLANHSKTIIPKIKNCDQTIRSVKRGRMSVVTGKRLNKSRVNKVLENKKKPTNSLKTQQVEAKDVQRCLSPTPSTSRSMSTSFSDNKKSRLILQPTKGTCDSPSPNLQGDKEEIISTLKRTNSVLIAGSSDSISPNFSGDHKKIFSTLKNIKSDKNMASTTHTEAIIPKIKINDQTTKNAKCKRMSVVIAKCLNKARRVSKKLENKKKPTNSFSKQLSTAKIKRDPSPSVSSRSGTTSPSFSNDGRNLPVLSSISPSFSGKKENPLPGITSRSTRKIMSVNNIKAVIPTIKINDQTIKAEEI